MDACVDTWLILGSVLFTVLAGFLTAHLFARNKTAPGKTDANPASFTEQSSKETLSGLGEPQTESEHTAQTIGELPDKQCAANQQEVAGDRCEKGESEHDFSSSHCPSVNRIGDADQALRYMPGVLRTSQLEKMMSKDELEEEQRVQREQLTAIFKLLQENQETFGEVTEKDMEEQLKLYSI